MPEPLLLGMNAKSSVRTYRMFGASSLHADNAFRPYFKEPFDMSFDMIRNNPSPRGLQSLSLIDIEVGAEHTNISTLAHHAKYSYRSKGSIARFDKAISELAKTAVKYHPLRAKNWSQFHSIRSIARYEEGGRQLEDVGAPLYRHVQGDEAKIKGILEFADKDIRGHISEHGFGKGDWFSKRSDEFMDTFGLDRSLGEPTSVYSSVLFQSMLRGIPTRHLMDLTLDYTKAIAPGLYGKVMEMTGNSDELHHTMLLNVASPERKKKLMKSHYRKLCTGS